LEGIQLTKEKGVHKGGKKKIYISQIQTLKKEGLIASSIARHVGYHRDSVYRLLKRAKF